MIAPPVPAPPPPQAADPKVSRNDPEVSVWHSPARLWQRKSTVIAVVAVVCLFVFLTLRFGLRTAPAAYNIPLLVTLVLGGLPLLYDLSRKLRKREFGSDLLGGISIITSVLLGEYLAGSIIVLMLSGGEALESHALRSASCEVIGLLATKGQAGMGDQADAIVLPFSALQRRLIGKTSSHDINQISISAQEGTDSLALIAAPPGSIRSTRYGRNRIRRAAGFGSSSACGLTRQQET